MLCYLTTSQVISLIRRQYCFRRTVLQTQGLQSVAHTQSCPLAPLFLSNRFVQYRRRTPEIRKILSVQWVQLTPLVLWIQLVPWIRWVPCIRWILSVQSAPPLPTRGFQLIQWVQTVRRFLQRRLEDQPVPWVPCVQ